MQALDPKKDLRKEAAEVDELLEDLALGKRGGSGVDRTSAGCAAVAKRRDKTHRIDPFPVPSFPTTQACQPDGGAPPFCRWLKQAPLQITK